MLFLLWIQQGYYSYDDLLPLELNRDNNKYIYTEHNRNNNEYIYTKCISSFRPEKWIVRLQSIQHFLRKLSQRTHQMQLL